MRSLERHYDIEDASDRFWQVVQNCLLSKLGATIVLGQLCHPKRNIFPISDIGKMGYSISQRMLSNICVNRISHQIVHFRLVGISFNILVHFLNFFLYWVLSFRFILSIPLVLTVFLYYSLLLVVVEFLSISLSL